MKVVLTKKSGYTFGCLPNGEVIEVKVPERFQHDPVPFAFAVLRREHPDENALDWDYETA